MPEPDPRAEVAELLAPSVESIIAKGFNEDFPGGNECRVTHFPLDPPALAVICYLNLRNVYICRRYGEYMMFTDEGVYLDTRLRVDRKDPEFLEESSYYVRVTVIQCKSYLSAIKAMGKQLRRKHDWKTYGPPKTGTFGNYALESVDGSTFLCVRFTTFFELSVEDSEYDESTCPWIDTGRIATTLDKAMKEHEGSIAELLKVETLPYCQPGVFTVGVPQPWEFDCFSDHRYNFHFEFEGENAYASKEGREYTSGYFNKDWGFAVTFRKKGTALLKIRAAHGSSLWPTEHEFVLEAKDPWEMDD